MKLTAGLAVTRFEPYHSINVYHKDNANGFMSSSYRLIWFQHFHKAAGSSVVKLAAANGEKLWSPNGNGNPLEENGELIPIWGYTRDELTEFIDRCEHEGVTFVATEWSAPNLEHLASDPRVTLITCLRDPLERFHSNYYYDYFAGYTHAHTPADYIGTGQAFTKFNYYCRVLSGEEEAERVDEAVCDRAEGRLELFDVRLSMGQKGFLAELANELSWEQDSMHINKSNTFSIRRICGLLLLGGPRLIWRRATTKKVPFSSEFQARFREENKWDFKLYNTIVGESARNSNE